jgi:WhiB family redox-sensing transcriptional regulator
MTWLESRNPAGPEEFSDEPAATAGLAAVPAPLPAPVPPRSKERALSLAQVKGENWRQRAACRRADPDLFFPVGPAGPALTQVTQAKRLCLACSVRRDCLDWAMRNGIQHGIWGGLTEDDRVSIRRTFTALTEGA